MKLLTESIRKTLPKLYANDNISLKDQIVRCKFFTPDSNWTWLVLEGQADVQRRDFIFFGYVIGQFSEAGNFLLSELESLRGPLGLPVERDRHLKPTRLGDLVPDL